MFVGIQPFALPFLSSSSSLSSRDTHTRGDTTAESDSGDGGNISSNLFMAFQVAVDSEGTYRRTLTSDVCCEIERSACFPRRDPAGFDYKAVKARLQQSFQRGLTSRERAWVKAQLRSLKRDMIGGDSDHHGRAMDTTSEGSDERKKRRKKRRKSRKKKDKPKSTSRQERRNSHGSGSVDKSNNSSESAGAKGNGSNPLHSASVTDAAGQNIPATRSRFNSSVSSELPLSASTIVGIGARDSDEGEAKQDSDFTRVKAFYEQYFPSKVKDLPNAFQLFAGKEKEMKYKVIQKYMSEAKAFFSAGARGKSSYRPPALLPLIRLRDCLHCS